MQEEKLFSIIIPCHNSFEYLIYCYKSLIEQTIGMDKLELIFVDDASTDNTFPLLCEFEKQYPDSVMVIRLDVNMRQGGARNIALKYATGKYVSFVDSDDQVAINMYEKLADVIQRYEPDIIKFSHDIVSEQGFVLREERQNFNGFYSIENAEKRRELLIGEYLDYGCWNKVYRREVVERVGAEFAEHVVYEEPRFTYPLYFAINNFYLLDEVLYHYTFNHNGTMQKDMKKSRKLYDHIGVQESTYEFIICNLSDEMLSLFREEIEAYFIKTYFCETILFACWGDLLLEISVLEQMKEWMKSKFPDYKNNKYVQRLFSKDHKWALGMMDAEFTQGELEEFLKEKNDDSSSNLGK